MTGKQRINAAMNLEYVDRIPFMCQMSIGHMLVQLGVSPLKFWFDKDTYVEGLLKLREQYNFDGILISLHGHSPNWRENIVKICKNEKNEVAHFENGDKIICPFNELPRYEFNNAPINENYQRQLPHELNYIPVSQNLPFFIDPYHKFDAILDIINLVGTEYSVHGEITSPFDYLLDFLGHQNALMELLIDPQNVHSILNHFTELIVKLADEMSETGVDAIKISSPFASSSFISQEQYLTFVQPYESKIIKVIRDNNVHAYLHTCGAIDDRLELMFDGGASGIECLDPKPLGNVDLKDAVRRIGRRGFIKGNIDSVNLLLKSDIGDIHKQVTNIINEGSKSSGFILSTACSIAPYVKKENIQIINSVLKELII